MNQECPRLGSQKKHARHSLSQPSKDSNSAEASSLQNLDVIRLSGLGLWDLVMASPRKLTEESTEKLGGQLAVSLK